jgi:hypothetical protein
MITNQIRSYRGMRHKKLNLSLVLLLVFGPTGVQAQQAILATGGNGSGSGGSAGYSVGQVVYSTRTGTNGSVAEGVQQPYEISIVDGLEEMSVNLNISSYPNPTSNYLILKVESIDLSTLSLQLYDINGKLLTSKKLTGNETIIEMSMLTPSVYYLNVTDDKKELRTCLKFTNH